MCNNYNPQFYLLFESHLPLQKNIVYATSHSVVNASLYNCFFSPRSTSVVCEVIIYGCELLAFSHRKNLDIYYCDII